jgi:hypothetical protein
MLDKLVHGYLSLPHVLNASTMLQTYEEKKKDIFTYRQTRFFKPASIFTFYRSLLAVPDHDLQTFLGDATLK